MLHVIDTEWGGGRERKGPSARTAPFITPSKKEALSLSLYHPFYEFVRGRHVLRDVGSMLVRSGAQKKKTWLQTVCFCQLRDAAKGLREQREEGRKGGRERGYGGEEERGKKSPQPSHQVEH